jgi:hypothetical protein
MIDSIAASCFVPLAYQSAKTIGDEEFVGGVFSNQIPIKNCITVTISPHGKANISPRQSASEIDVDSLYDQGFEDCIDWFMIRKREGILHPLLFN